MSDAAEKWLRDNDPDYKNTHKDWQTPSTDVLARSAEKHPSMAELKETHPHGSGHYRSKSGNVGAANGGDLFDYSAPDSDPAQHVEFKR